MVGEIRDSKRFRIAIKAALTATRALDAAHQRRALDHHAYGDMGIEPFNVASAVNLIVAQRLVRRVCKECKASTSTPPKRCTPSDRQEGGPFSRARM